MMTHRSSASSSTYRAASRHHYQQRDSRPDDPMELGAISTERHHQSNRFVSNRSATPGPSHRRSTTPAPPPRTSTAGLTKLTTRCPPPLVPGHHLLFPQKKLGIVAQAGSTCAPLPQQQPDHLPMSNTTLASPPPPSLPSPLSTANTSPSLSSENFVSTTPAPSAFSPSLLRPLARFIAGTRRALVRRGSPKPQIPQLSISSTEPCPDLAPLTTDRICVPSDPALRLRLLHEYHDTPTSGHPGYLKTLNSIASHYWWPRMTRTVKSYVSSCATCQRIKPSTQLPPGLLQPHAVPVRPWSHVSMDLITDLPKSQCHDTLSYDSIVTFVDMLTKQAIFVRANKSITSQQLAHVFIDHVFSKHGLPSVIVSDRDPRITSEFWQTLFTQLGSKLNLSTAHHPQTDGQTEITHRTIEQILRAYVSPQHNDWATWLPLAEFAYNSHVHSSTQQTPFLANYGFHPTTPSSLLLPPDSINPDATSFLDNLRNVQDRIRHQLDLAKARPRNSSQPQPPPTYLHRW
ncbi:hypothetical protein CEUSTIGMA_g11661.t1 [Chlamydomonas eustigma]|uniref:Integrase catalytic domain-containing protein n=1 Tax=Chlamydomonas eustigma TaxID=1157962 RepID=A0A250XME2_9CHLO|nr:hypothetical protein CEUSTIGMA_g11661.t1 [Chlamydomonas eustigma]|eukprot:GAX84238.1 hypothetical protein CEUSTIGMA_g11661.t1 [Chlamydomonas eustigma]